MKRLALLVVQVFIVLGLLFENGWAQSPYDAPDAGQETPAPAPAPELDNSSAVAGPTVYVSDFSGHLGTIDLGRERGHIVGRTGVVLTDIAFAPNGTLYGVSYSQFFRVNKVTGRATLIGNLGIGDMNALVIDSRGHIYAEGYSSSTLYTIDVTTGAARPIGEGSPEITSAGDLVFYNDKMLLAGLNGDTTVLVNVNPATGQDSNPIPVQVQNLYGLASTGKNELFGFANTRVYKLDPAAKSAAGRAKLLFDVAQSGLGQITGTAYNGNFQP